MLKKLKSIFCNHLFYAYLSDKPHYTSIGDEFYDRKSRHYYLICEKCNKRIDVVDVWTNENVLQVLREKEAKLNQAVESLEWIIECGTDYQSINKARNALHFINGGEKDDRTTNT